MRLKHVMQCVTQGKEFLSNLGKTGEDWGGSHTLPLSLLGPLFSRHVHSPCYVLKHDHFFLP